MGWFGISLRRNTHKQYKSLLSKLPARFNLGNVYFQFESLEALKKQKEFVYTLEENQGHENGI